MDEFVPVCTKRYCRTNDSTSVIQVRSQDVMPEAIGADQIRVLRQHEGQLQSGAIITVDEMTSRLRILPIRRKSGESG